MLVSELNRILDGLAQAKDLVERARDVGEVLDTDVDDVLQTIGRIEMDVEDVDEDVA